MDGDYVRSERFERVIDELYAENKQLRADLGTAREQWIGTHMLADANRSMLKGNAESIKRLEREMVTIDKIQEVNQATARTRREEAEELQKRTERRVTLIGGLLAIAVILAQVLPRLFA